MSRLHIHIAVGDLYSEYPFLFRPEIGNSSGRCP
jgi:hypothetical protein